MQTQISCPNCGTPYMADVQQVIDVGREPRLKELLLSGQLNFAVCPNCGAGGRIATPLLYHDPAHDLLMVHVPQEMNLDQVRREEFVGRMVQQVVNQTPMEQRRGYMLQPQTILTMQTFMEKVWGTEGVTPEMLARQQKQVDLLRTLATADSDVQDFLIKDRASEIDETFFNILRTQIDAMSQAGDPNEIVGLLNLQAKLMTSTEIGRRLEKQQVALHGLSRDAKKAGGLTTAMLAEHILKNEHDDEVVDAIAMTGNAALTYEFFTLLTDEEDKRQKRGDKEGAQRVGRIRDRLLEMQREMQQATQAVMREAQATLDEILAAADTEQAVLANLGRIDDVFMHVLEARQAHAGQSGKREELEKLRVIQETVIGQLQGQTPPEVQFLSQLVSAPNTAERERLMNSAPEMLTGELLQLVDMISEQANGAGQAELVQRLGSLRSELSARLAAEGGN